MSDKPQLTPKLVEIATLLNDGSLRMIGKTPPAELHRLLHIASAQLTLKTIQRLAEMERLLRMLQDRFELGTELAVAVHRVLHEEMT